MAQRASWLDSRDDFPTPPWATRALVEHVLGGREAVASLTCLEPACGRGFMAKPLSEAFGSIDCSDAYDYGYAVTRDFLTEPYANESYDWVVTNPPFRQAEEFVERALAVAKVGVAILARTVFLESAVRYRAIFEGRPPTVFAQFVERVPIFRGRVDKAASTATGYAWFVWRRDVDDPYPRLTWIPPCRRTLEFDGDYDLPTSILSRRRNIGGSAERR